MVITSSDQFAVFVLGRGGSAAAALVVSAADASVTTPTPPD
jgi:hypothetical protein